MKLAIIGSRDIQVEQLGNYIPRETCEIVSGGARGVDTCAAAYAKEHDVPLREFLPDYAHYGRVAPLKRNEEIAEYADGALVFWDGRSKGTANTIHCFKKRQKPVTVILVEREL